jgi:predicted transcriptional regulator
MQQSRLKGNAMPVTNASSKLSIRVPADLSLWLDKEAQQANLSKSEMMVDALRDYQIKKDYLKALNASRDEETKVALAGAEDDANLVSGKAVFASARKMIKAKKRSKTAS